MKRSFLVGTLMTLALGAAGAATAQTSPGTDPQGTQPGGQLPPEQIDTDKDTDKDVLKGSTDIEQDKQEKKTVGQSAQSGTERLPSIKLSALDHDQAVQLQEKLQALGYYKGEIDGKIGKGTRGALSQFFRDQSNLVSQGRLSDLVMMGFGFDQDEVERVRGVEGQEGVQPREPVRGDEPDTKQKPQQDWKDQGTEPHPSAPDAEPKPSTPGDTQPPY